MSLGYVFVFVLSLLGLASAGVPEPTLVKDIPGFNNSVGSRPEYLCTSNGFVYFCATSFPGVKQLWRSDGTAVGTTMVKSIVPTGSNDTPAEMFEYNGIVYFSVLKQLWRSDGTANGTYKVSSANPKGFFARDDGLYFWSSGKLCRTDGTSEGTVAFTKNYPSISAEVFGSVEIEDTLFVVRGVRDENRAGITFYPRLIRKSLTELNKEETLVGSVQQVHELVVRPPASGSPVFSDQSVLFFFGKPKVDGADSLYLCTKEGESKQLRSAFAPVGNSTLLSTLRLWGNKAIFTVTNSYGSVRSIWYSDGTSSGTRPVFTDGVERIVLETVGLKCYFLQQNARDPALYDLCCMNADEPTVVVLKKRLGLESTVPLQIIGDTLFLRLWNEDSYRLWRTQGTPASTWEIPGAVPQGTDSLKDRLALSGNQLFMPLIHPDFGAELHVQDVTPQLRMEVWDAAENGFQMVEDDEVMDELVCSSDGTMQPVQMRLILDGFLEVTDLEISSAAGWLVTAVDGLRPGMPEAVQLTFTAGAESSLETTVVFRSEMAGITHTLHFRVRVLESDAAPEIWHIPASRLVLAGEELSLSPAIATGSEPTAFSWQHDGQEVGTEPTLSLPAVTLADAGDYRLTVVTPSGTVTSGAVSVGVVQRAVAEYQYFLEKELTLSCVASTAPGNTLTYQWLRNGVPLTDPAGFYGVQKATLRIPQASSEFRGDYECVVTMTDSDGQVSLSHGLTEAFYLASEKPGFINPQVFWHFIGQAIQIQLLADQPDCTFTATGLPQGLKMNRSGLITGTLTKCSEYSVTIRVRNAVGAGLPAKFIWGVSRFISSGNYEGLIERNGSLDGGLAQGSLVKITATSRGSLSGKLMHAGKTWRFAKSLPFDPLGTSYERNIFFTIPQGKGAEPLTLVLGVGPESISYNSYNMTLVDVDGQESEGELHNILSSPNYPWYALKVPLVWSLAPSESLAEGAPQGAGFLTATATPDNPTIVWKGRLADGTAITGSGSCWTPLTDNSGTISVHCPLYRGRGMLHGTLIFNSTQSGVLTWNKDALPGGTRERVYPSGFTLQTLTAMNGAVSSPFNDLLMQIPEGEQNALVSIVGSSVPGLEMSQTFTLTSKPKVKLPAVDAEHFIKSLSFDSKTYTFKGTLVIPNEEDRKLSRTVPFQGCILHYDQVSLGYFLLPELPALDQPASSLKKTPVQSCLIQIEAAENGDL